MKTYNVNVFSVGILCIFYALFLKIQVLKIELSSFIEFII